MPRIRRPSGRPRPIPILVEELRPRDVVWEAALVGEELGEDGGKVEVADAVVGWVGREKVEGPGTVVDRGRGVLAT